VNHPDAAAWMTFLYGELPVARRHEMQTHLKGCPVCTAQVKAWRESITALDTWRLPPRRAARPVFLPALKWAAAAGFLLAFGIFLGRQTSSNAAEIAALKASVAALASSVQQENAATITNSLTVARNAANAESVRLLTEYSRLQDTQRSADRQAVNLALQSLDTRLTGIRSELETVALNTETGFKETSQGLARVALLSLPNSQPQ
jgi:anti-sigma factor RsiW